jgi:hypothetical protein
MKQYGCRMKRHVQEKDKKKIPPVVAGVARSLAKDPA